MALSTYTDTNRVVSNPLVTTFETVYKGFIGGSGRERWDITRTRTKTYKYVSLTEDAATACVEYLNAYWMRPVYDINAWSYDLATGFTRPLVKNKELVADIRVFRDAGGVSTVEVTINEIMQLPIDTEGVLDYTISALQNLFVARIGVFDYDGETGI